MTGQDSHTDRDNFWLIVCPVLSNAKLFLFCCVVCWSAKRHTPNMSAGPAFREPAKVEVKVDDAEAPLAARGSKRKKPPPLSSMPRCAVLQLILLFHQLSITHPRMHKLSLTPLSDVLLTSGSSFCSLFLRNHMVRRLCAVLSRSLGLPGLIYITSQTALPFESEWGMHALTP